ncbi:sensor domain-containing protein [Streptacidiphilus sp. N1-3]|uniref:histidine kinase n=1 Tax=Streptacidiphilus alkalitolerans TaxID=3342712 RepID=A0ABV6WT82_9ACTN
MSGTTVGRTETARSWLSSRLGSVRQGLTLHLLVYPGMAALIFALVAGSLLELGLGLFLLPIAMAGVRSIAGRRRQLVREWTGTAIADPYLPEPGPETLPEGWLGQWRRCQWILSDPATWRDLLWLLVDPFVGGFLALLPLALILEGVYGFVISAFAGPMTQAGYNDWYLFLHVHKGHTGDIAATSAIGVLLIGLGLWSAPKLLDQYGRWSSVLLSPTPAAVLVQRVEQLTVTRTDAVDSQAAELRRIERDLHDGAQARLVAMGMNLGAAVQLLEHNPEQARAMLLEARDSSAKALTELRDLVRGIHPPVLSDRGLGDAVRALALDSALSTEVTVDLPGRLDAPVESAAYFAVAEALANAGKHAGAGRVWIDIEYRDGRLLMTVRDDGSGGADSSRGTGLRGIERRLAAFDGILALSSPLGGPTVITVELPCVLSSPKTSSS